MGEVPDWYTLVRAAKYLGVAPWELEERWVFWTEAALVAEDIETTYAEDQQARSARHAQR